MIGDKPKGLRAHLPFIYPAVTLVVFFVIPFGIMVAVSFFHRVPGAFYTPSFDVNNYRNLFTALENLADPYERWMASTAALYSLLPLTPSKTLSASFSADDADHESAGQGANGNGYAGLHVLRHTSRYKHCAYRLPRRLQQELATAAAAPV